VKHFFLLYFFIPLLEVIDFLLQYTLYLFNSSSILQISKLK